MQVQLILHYRGPSCQPRPRGAILTPHGEGHTARKDPQRTGDSSWQDFRPGTGSGVLNKIRAHCRLGQHCQEACRKAVDWRVERYPGGSLPRYHGDQIHRSKVSSPWRWAESTDELPDLISHRQTRAHGPMSANHLFVTKVSLEHSHASSGVAFALRGQS